MLFLNPLFLVAAAAGALPVLIHLMFRRRAKTMSFPSIVFLRQLDKEVIRRRRVQEILIMILRVLVLVLFAVFLAKPILRANLFFGSSAKSVVIIVDDSYSMTATGDRSAFEKAKERALSVIGSLSANDQAAIITTSGSAGGMAETLSLSSDFEALRLKAESLTPSFMEANLNVAFRRAIELLEDSGGKNGLIFLVTDMQRRNWQQLKPVTKNETAPLVIVDVGEDSRGRNLAISDVAVSSKPDDIARRVFTFRTKVRNFSDEDAETPLGMYTSAEKLVDETSIDVGPGDEKDTALVFRPGEEGWHAGSFKLGPDVLSADNAGYYAFNVRQAVKVGIYAQDPLSKVGYDQFFFLSKTIDPLEQAYPFDVTRLGDLKRETLEKYDVIVFASLSSAKDDELAGVREYIEEGGRALVFADDTASIPALTGIMGGVDLGRFEKGIFKIGDDSFGLSELFLDVDVYERLPASIAESSAAYPLASFQDGKPFVIERISGKGAILFVTTGYDVEMTNLPFRHASVPLLFQMLFRLAKETEIRQFTCGDSLKVEPGWSMVVTPRQETIELDGIDEFPMTMPGLYVVKSKEGPGYATGLCCRRQC